MNFGTLGEVKKQLASKWGRGVFLKAEVSGESVFPIEIALKGPTSSQISANFDEIRNWIHQIKSGCEKAGIRIEWKEINHRLLGRNVVPRKIFFEDIAQLTGFIGKKAEFRRFKSSFNRLSTTFPELAEWAGAHPFDLIRCADELEKLFLVTEWMVNHPRPGIYLRQLSLPGVDTKFIEKNRKLLSTWFDIVLDPACIDECYTGVSKFALRYSFTPRPVSVRFRILDSAYSVDGFSDLSIPASEFLRWNPEIKRIFIVENDVTALAFPSAADSILIFGRGYNFDALASVDWMKSKELWYWGDIDTHGFAILNQFREKFPHTRSFFMDRETLLSHRVHWGSEPKQAAAVDLPNLNREEAALYYDLKNNKIHPNVRLEQEFIDFSLIEKWLLSAVLE